MKIKKNLLLSALSFLILFAVLGTYTFRNLGNWLIVSDPLPDSLDVLVTFAGDLDRYEYSKQLKTRYPKAQWFISTAKVPMFDTLTLGTLVRQDVVKKGFDTATIFVNDTCTTTWAEINLLAFWLKNNRPKFESTTHLPRIAFVSSPYHSRRVMIEAKRRIDPTEFQLLSIPVPNDKNLRNPLHPNDWWMHSDDAKYVYSEVIKLVYYHFKYR